jgi:hypothetical protein
MSYAVLVSWSCSYQALPIENEKLKDARWVSWEQSSSRSLSS